MLADVMIQDAVVRDAAEILALQKLAYLSEAALYDDHSLPPLVQTLESMAQDIREQVTLKALLAGRIIGSVRARQQGEICYIGRLIVHPEYQNHGLGAQLLQAIEARFPGVACFELFTGHRSTRNLHFYQKRGYRPVRQAPLAGEVILIYLQKDNEERTASMDALEAIMKRRSIRNFSTEPIPDEVLEKILAAGAQAPSAKNRQPWRFIVVRGEKKAEMLQVIREGLDKWKARGEGTGSAEGTLGAVARAPVTVFIFNPEGMHPWLTRSIEQAFGDLMNIQSVGAAIENMAVAAYALGVGSLWNGDITYTYDEVCKFLGQDCQLVAAMSFGYPAGRPGPTERRSLAETVVWL